MRHVVALGVAILVGSPALVAGSASAAGHPTWLAPIVLAPPGAGDATGPRVAVDAEGETTVVWSARHPTDEGVVETSFRPAGGTFGPKQAISQSGLWAGPDLGVDGSGNATVVWSSGPNYRSQVVQAAVRPARGSFGAPADLTQPGTIAPRSPRIAVDARGDAIAMWLADGDAGRTLRAAFRPAGSGFQPPRDVFTATATRDINNFFFDLAMAPNGNAIAIWTGESAVWSAYSPVAGQFGQPQLLARAAGTSYVSDAHVAIDSAGDAIGAWWNSGTMQAAARFATSGAWQSPQAIGDASACCGYGRPSVVLDANGNGVVAWVSADRTVQASTQLARSGAWGAPQILSPADRSLVKPPAVAVGKGGDVVVAWVPDRPTAAIVAAVRPRGGSFTPAEDAWQGSGYPGDTPRVAVDPQGNATVVWRTLPSLLPRDSHSGSIQAAGYDAVGPQLRTLRIPRSGRVGARLRFSVSPLDVWSGVASTRWDFGGGARRKGRTVSHIYRHAGRYRVTVRSIDRLGNTAASTRSVRIVAR